MGPGLWMRLEMFAPWQHKHQHHLPERLQCRCVSFPSPAHCVPLLSESHARMQKPRANNVHVGTGLLAEKQKIQTKPTTSLAMKEWVEKPLWALPKWSRLTKPCAIRSSHEDFSLDSRLLPFSAFLYWHQCAVDV